MITFWVGIILLLGTTLCQDFTCPRDEFNVCVDGDYPVPDNCTLYYDCVTCQSRVEQCAAGLHFDADAQSCRSPYLAGCDPAYDVLGSVFCVAATASESGPQDPLILQEVLVNDESAYDPSTGHYMTRATGIYLFHISAGTQPSDRVDMRLDFNQVPLYNIKRDSTVHNKDVISRDMMIELNLDTQVLLTIEPETSVSSLGRNTLWAGFMLEALMSPFYAFSATCSIAPANGVIVFDSTLVHIGSVYNPSTGIFTAPMAGIYYFSFSTGLRGFGNHRSQFRSNMQGNIAELRRQFGDHNSFDTLSKAIMVNLQADEEMTIFLVDGQAENTQDTLLTFTGFLYNPEIASAGHAWSVHRTISDSGPTSPLTFDIVTVNEGSLFDTASSSVTVIYSGYYFISMVIGADDNQPVDVELVVNNGTGDVVECTIQRDGFHYQNIDTISRSILLHIKAASNVSLRRQATSTVYSDIGRQTSWTGFLLQETASHM